MEAKYSKGQLSKTKGLVHEDQLPEMSSEEYSEWFKASEIIDGVRMGPEIKIKLVVSNNEWFSCKSCKISSSTKGRLIPCPRGGCEAEITHTVVTITRTAKFKKNICND